MRWKPRLGLGSLALAGMALAGLVFLAAGCATSGAAPRAVSTGKADTPAPLPASSAATPAGSPRNIVPTAATGGSAGLALPAGPPARSAVEIQGQVAGSRLLDGVHASAGIGCEGCHGVSAPPDSPAIPTMDDCLSCHGGSYESLAAGTDGLGERNPHYSHEGEIECADCHRVHRPFEHYCNACHSFGVPDKYRIST